MVFRSAAAIRQPADEKQYRTNLDPTLAGLTSLINLIVFGPAVGLIFVQITTYGFSPELTFASAILLGLGVALNMLHRRYRNLIILVISPQKIEYRTPSLSISSGWDNIDRIELVPFNRGFTWNLILRQPVPPMDSKGNLIIGPQCSAIPLAAFSNNGYNIASDIRQNAPHLFL
jgi:hypothetical protein